MLGLERDNKERRGEGDSSSRMIRIIDELRIREKKKEREEKEEEEEWPVQSF